MGDTYAKSGEVFACVGPSEKRSEAIAKSLPIMDDLIHELVEYGYDWRHTDCEWYPPETSSSAVLLEVLEHFDRSTRRSYFSRVWIVQELFGGLNSTTVLCESDVLAGTSLWSCTLSSQVAHTSLQAFQVQAATMHQP